MKIAILLNLPLCRHLIHDTITVKFAWHLARQGHRVDLYYSGHETDEGIHAYYGLQALPTLRFIACARLKITRPVKLSSARVTQTHMAWQLLAQHRKVPYDLFFTNDASLLFFRHIAARLGVPMVYEAHDTLPAIPRGLALILTTTEALRDRYLAMGTDPNSVRTLPLAPNTPRFCALKQFDSYDTRHLIYAGKLHPHRGVDTLIEALSRLPEDFRLTLYGGNASEVARYGTLLRQKGIHHRVTLAGFVPPSELEELLASQTGIHVVPPLDLPRYRTIAHTKISDALGRGRLLVASDLPPIREIADGVAELFRPGDATALKDAVLTLAGSTPEAIARRHRAMEARYHQLSYPERAARFFQMLSEASS